MMQAASAVLLLLLAASSTVSRAAQTQCIVEHSLDGGSSYQRIGLLQLDDDTKVRAVQHLCVLECRAL